MAAMVEKRLGSRWKYFVLLLLLAAGIDFLEFMFRTKRPNHDSADVTVAVQLSMDRLMNLERLGNSWQGPVSASVYIPHPRNSAAGRSLLSELSKFHTSVDSKGVFTLDIGVVFGLDGIEEMNATLSDTKAFRSVPLEEQYRFMYPVNVGRNVALAQVRTDLTLLLDVDFVLSKQTREAALGGNPYWENVLCEIRYRAPLGQGMFAVLPAFKAMQGRPPPLDKESVISSYIQGHVGRMSGHIITHCPTDFQYWMKSKHDYVIQYGTFFEPYGIAATELIPWFPENFKGYHLNKVITYFEMAATGWDFVVLPDHFVVHLWHPPSQMRSLIAGNRQLRNHIEKCKNDFVLDLASRGNTCDPQVLVNALKSDVRVIEGGEISVGSNETLNERHCAQLHGMGNVTLQFPS